ncbi:Spy/CpxP family protein refolding chaperone [Conchiformibius kuhniae]|uniref:Spy/CpxP family protein refolding chaperone n=1 Tax=Conchiformibius kuhniae TaxID=211502 RepID=A0A8T9MQV2_9NEIS|nr:Spy/CpxP family protein refolding chaperone [Conchiformibius kuhniae]UOP04290.1 Spy/CpxP family protein refolding chaperone [Conchiformibius kuhniae]
MQRAGALVLSLFIGMNFAAAADAVRHGGEYRRVRGDEALPRGFDKLDLSAAQKAQIRAIVRADQETRQSPESVRAQREALRRKMQSWREQERRLLGNRRFDEEAAQRLIAERHQERLAWQRQQHELRMLKKRHAIFQVLTPEQQRRYREMQYGK